MHVWAVMIDGERERMLEKAGCSKKPRSDINGGGESEVIVTSNSTTARNTHTDITTSCLRPWRRACLTFRQALAFFGRDRDRTCRMVQTAVSFDIDVERLQRCRPRDDEKRLALMLNKCYKKAARREQKLAVCGSQSRASSRGVARWPV